MAVLLILLLTAAQISSCREVVSAEEATASHQQLSLYLNALNDSLERFGESPINSIFEQYSSFAVFGITDMPDSSIPENVEITVYMQNDRISKLILRVCDPDRFVNIAASVIAALSDSITEGDAKRKPESITAKVKQDPSASFEDPVTDLAGENACVYFAYFPNQYHDDINWLQMTVIFPITGFGSGTVGYLTDQDPSSIHNYDEDVDASYEGYWSEDSFSHYEVFTTATPEPDSAAAEQSEKILRTE